MTEMKSPKFPDRLRLSPGPNGEVPADFQYSEQTQFTVYRRGRLSASYDGDVIYECGPWCSCPPTCGHRIVGSSGPGGPKCTLGLTPSCGWGLKAAEPIPAGTYFAHYAGELITAEEADEAEDDTYIFELDAAKDVNNNDCTDGLLCIDASQKGNLARFINHSCQPNLRPVKVQTGHRDTRAPTVAFFAERAIAKGEELSFDYGEGFWLVKWREFLCACGAEECRYSDDSIDTFLQLCAEESGLA